MNYIYLASAYKSKTVILTGMKANQEGLKQVTGKTHQSSILSSLKAPCDSVSVKKERKGWQLAKQREGQRKKEREQEEPIEKADRY